MLKENHIVLPWNQFLNDFSFLLTYISCIYPNFQKTHKFWSFSYQTARFCQNWAGNKCCTSKVMLNLCKFSSHNDKRCFSVGKADFLRGGGLNLAHHLPPWYKSIKKGMVLKGLSPYWDLKNFKRNKVMNFGNPTLWPPASSLRDWAFPGLLTFPSCPVKTCINLIALHSRI